nr:BPK_HP1_G0043910.mRNA.1.CDS.1 [Saccharomyces cerevisiae]
MKGYLELLRMWCHFEVPTMREGEWFNLIYFNFVRLRHNPNYTDIQMKSIFVTRCSPFEAFHDKDATSKYLIEQVEEMIRDANEETKQN